MLPRQNLMLIDGLVLRHYSVLPLLHTSCTESKRICKVGYLGSLLIVDQFFVTTQHLCCCTVVAQNQKNFVM